MNLSQMIQQDKTTLVDVRETYEFATGHATGAINIPLSTIGPGRLKEFRQMSAPIVVYCRSGNRSGQAMNYLKANGLAEVYNGGSLSEVNKLKKVVVY
jgi:rhodanese-related sulfurtransferase